MPEPTVSGHYTTGSVIGAILGALEAAGHDTDKLDPEVLGPLEEFHVLGRVATQALAEVAAVTAEDEVVDVGCGIGGAARYLHRTYGCPVTGIDLTDEFCVAARELNARTGLAEGIDIHQGDATAMEFPDARFSLAWTIHVAMNIADKARLYREMRRVLRPGGRVALYDIVAGPVQPLHFPVPWASGPEMSFVVPADEIRRLIEAAGLTVDLWQDATDEAAAFFARQAPTGPEGGHLGLHVFMPDFPARLANAGRNMKENRIRVLRCVATAS